MTTSLGNLWTKPVFLLTPQDTLAHTRGAKYPKIKKIALVYFLFSSYFTDDHSPYVIETWVQVLAYHLLHSVITLNFRFLICKLAIILMMVPGTLLWEFKARGQQRGLLGGSGS